MAGKNSSALYTYKAPLDDMRFVLNEVLNIQDIFAIPGMPATDDEMVNQFLNLGAQITSDVLAPLNRVGDLEGCIHDAATKSVKTPTGFKDAYKQFCESGLTAITCDEKYGGLGMPALLGTAISEMVCSANLAFGMYPGLSHGAYNALYEYGTDELKNAYLPKIVSGEWSGTMCLTEPGAGTDLGLMTTKAVKQSDGTYAISGTKIFISAGEHDMTSNICHLTLAKIDDPSTPKGIKGISLFLVPKFLPDASGQYTVRNTVTCGNVEEKMGIHGNSTCVMNFDSAKGFLVGEIHKGMKAMFVMMNDARLGVGLQGLGLSEVAYQHAVHYAMEIRKQGQAIDQKMSDPNVMPEPVFIIDHPEVRRELLTIKSQVEGARMLAYWTAMQLDLSIKHPDEKVRKKAKKLLDILTPIVKAHLTDNAVNNTNSAIQVFGGNGFIEEYGMAQFNRDARITRIYEGTNGVQALDLMGRKILKEQLLGGYLKHLSQDLSAASRNGVAGEFLKPVRAAVWKLRWATLCMQAKLLWAHKVKGDAGPAMRYVASIATDYLNLMSLVVMGHMWVKMVDVATQQLKKDIQGKSFYEEKIKTARFYMNKIMPQQYTFAANMRSGSLGVTDIEEKSFVRTQTTIGEKTLKS